ncbi:DUF4355 domain-containing protein [Ruminococcaceae bacterium OttesenSCG-928-I18]|nr:DUF4355 domain-containing protein [Ruminococcaceae bacterium OttesenSCG-928-I18]
MFTMDELRQQRKEEKITEEQFSQLARLFCGEYVAEHPDEFPEEEPPVDPGADEEKLQKMIATEVGRATNKLGNENKDLKAQLEQLKNEKLSDEDRAKLALAERESTIAKREAELADKENRLYAVKAIKAAGLDDGGDSSLALVDFVLGDTPDDIDTNVKAFHALVKKIVQSEIDRLFKEKGHNPKKGGGGADAGPNPYKQETWNVTQQWELEANNPEKAASLKAVAGA